MRRRRTSKPVAVRCLAQPCGNRTHDPSGRCRHHRAGSPAWPAPVRQVGLPPSVAGSDPTQALVAPDDGWDPAQGPHPAGGYDEVVRTTIGGGVELEFRRAGRAHRTDGPARLRAYRPGNYFGDTVHASYALDGRQLHRHYGEPLLDQGFSLIEADAWDRLREGREVGVETAERWVETCVRLRGRGLDPDALAQELDEANRAAPARQRGLGWIDQPDERRRRVELISYGVDDRRFVTRVVRADVPVAAARTLWGDGSDPAEARRRADAYVEVASQLGTGHPHFWRWSRMSERDKLWAAELLVDGHDAATTTAWSAAALADVPLETRGRLIGVGADPQRLGEALRDGLAVGELDRVVAGEPLEWVAGWAVGPRQL